MDNLETQKMELRSTLKSLNFKKDRIACEMAEAVGITGYFFSDELPFDDPRINQKDAEKFHQLKDQIYDVTWKLNKLENEHEKHIAMQTCFDFINLLSLEEAVKFLKSVGADTTFDLVDKLVENPHLIEEVVLNE